MRLLKLFKMRKLLFTLCILISLAASSFAQIDNGTNYISDSKTKKIATKSQCDVIFTKKGDIIIALVKDTFAEIVKYKTCKDYITNATVSGAIVTLPTYEIDKIVFSNQLTKYYRVKRPITRSRNEIFKGENINPNESLKRNFLFPFMKQKSLSLASLKKPTNKTKTALDKSNFVYISSGFGSEYPEAFFTDIGFLKQKNKKFGIGTSFSYIFKPAQLYFNFFNGNNEYITPTINYFSLLIDFKFNFLTEKRIQPFIITSLGGTYRYVGEGYFTSINRYYDELIPNARISSGIDFISKNNKWMFSPSFTLPFLSLIGPIIEFKYSFGF